MQPLIKILRCVSAMNSPGSSEAGREKNGGIQLLEGKTRGELLEQEGQFQVENDFLKYSINQTVQGRVQTVGLRG